MANLIQKIKNYFKQKSNKQSQENSNFDDLVANLNVIGYGHVNGSNSLAAFNRAFFKALQDCDAFKLWIQPVESKFTEDLNAVPLKDKQWIEECLLSKSKKSSNSINIFSHNPLLIPENKEDTNILLFFWEESLVSETVIKTINLHYDGVLVVTNFVKKVLIDFGCEKKIYVIDPGLTFIPEPAETLRKDSKFFLFSNSRKPSVENKIIKTPTDSQEFFNGSRVAKQTLHACHEIKLTKGNKKKIKLGWLSPWGNECGIAEYSNFILKEFDLEDVNINIYSLSEIKTNKEQKYKISFFDINKNQKNNINFVNKAIEDKIDILVIQYNFNFFPISKFLSCIELLKKEQIKVVLVFHATKPLYALKKTLFSKLELCDRILVHTIEDMNFLKSYGLTRNTTFLPQGVLHLPEENTLSINLPTFNKNKLIIGSYGFFMPHKGIFQLINAFKKLLKSIPDVRLVLINAEYRSLISKEEIKRCMFHAKQLGIYHLIEWHNDFKTNEESLSLIGKCDFMVFPYQKTEESTSAAVRMALASRKPVLTTPLAIFDDIKEITYQLKGINTQDILAGILDFLELSDDERREIMSKQNQWLIDNDWKKISNRLQGMLKGLVINS